MPTMNYSCLYLAELRSIQNRCNFATICARKGYALLILVSSLHYGATKFEHILFVVKTLPSITNIA